MKDSLGNDHGEAPPRLTRRESEVLQELRRGHRNGQIARSLGISPRTVEKHCENLFRKLGVANRLEAALYGRNRMSRDSGP